MGSAWYGSTGASPSRADTRAESIPNAARAGTYPVDMPGGDWYSVDWPDFWSPSEEAGTVSSTVLTGKYKPSTWLMKPLYSPLGARTCAYGSIARPESDSERGALLLSLVWSLLRLARRTK